MQKSDVDPSRPGSGVWEKSDNSRWISVAEGSHKLPRTRLASEGSVDPGLSIQTFISSFEVELPRVGDQSSLVSDGSSLVRFDRPVLERNQQDSSELGEAGPSSGGNSRSAGRQAGQERSRKSRKQKRRKNKPAPAAPSLSVESSPGRDCPSPDSLVQILHKYQHRNDCL